MEFIYSAFNNCQTLPVKGKISRWRHLETISTQFILIGLVFFLILQNGNLRSEISSKLSHQIVEDIFTEKIAQLTKEIEQGKLLLLDTSKKHSLHAEELKKIIRILIKEIGLPLPQTTRQVQSLALLEEQQPNREFFKKASSQAAQQQRNQFIDERFEEDERQEEESQEEQHSQQEENEVYFQEPTTSKVSETASKLSQKCTYVEYLSESVKESRSNQNEGQNQQDDASAKILTSNKSRKRNNVVSFSFYLNQLKSFLMVAGNLILICLVFVCLFVLGSLVKNPKYRCKSEQAFEAMLKASSKKEEATHRMKQEKVLKA